VLHHLIVVPIYGSIGGIKSGMGFVIWCVDGSRKRHGVTSVSLLENAHIIGTGVGSIKRMGD